MRIGVDVGGTFTDLVCFDPATGELSVVKLPSTPPGFHLAVIDAVGRVMQSGRPIRIVHGSTVATNALLQRSGEPCAFATTEGFGDMLLIGRQNRPRLYALHVTRPRPLTSEENWFTVRERIDCKGQVIEALTEPQIDRLIDQILSRGLRHVAVCLLFSFVNPVHEQMIGQRCARAGMTVSLSSEILPEFREYERASTTVINAALRPTVQQYLEALAATLRQKNRNVGPKNRDGSYSSSGEAGDGSADGANPEVDGKIAPVPIFDPEVRIMHSGGGTLSVPEAQASAARLVLSGPAGGVIGAAFMGASAGFRDLITYDMGGTSTDVATIIDGQPQWTTSSMVDGLPLGLAALDIHTVGAGGGSVAYLDPGGALRVGPRSAGAVPGPACYNRGGAEPTVTDANLVLGRILADDFAGGAMPIYPDLARRALEPLASAMGRTVAETALGIVRVAENNMGRAVRAVTSQRGLDPRRFTLLSFGGAGGLHACALAESLEIPRVLVPPCCGVLSALGMVVAPPVVDASRTVVHLGDQLDDARLAAEFGLISGQTMDVVPYDQTAAVEAYADVRFHGQSHELTVRIHRPSRDHIAGQFIEAYQIRYGQVPSQAATEIVTLRVRRIGHVAKLRMPPLHQSADRSRRPEADVTLGDGVTTRAPVMTRAGMPPDRVTPGPLLLVDPEATAFVPPGWQARAGADGSIILERI